jgi:hypothetical protein
MSDAPDQEKTKDGDPEAEDGRAEVGRPEAPDSHSPSAEHVQPLPVADTSNALALEGIARAYRTGSGLLQILLDAKLTVAPGEMVAIVAPPEPGNRRSCTSPVFSNGPTPGKSISAARRHRI